MHRQNFKFKIIFVRFVAMFMKTLRVETLEKNRLCLQRYDLSCVPWSTLIRVTWCRQQYCRQKREERNIMPSGLCHIFHGSSNGAGVHSHHCICFTSKKYIPHMVQCPFFCKRLWLLIMIMIKTKKTKNGEYMFCHFDQFSAKGYSHLSLSDCYKQDR